MPCSSPSGAFIGLTVQELLELRANALLGIENGRRTSISGGAKSGSKQWDIAPDKMLIEVNYALRKLGAMPARPQKVTQILTEWPPQGLGSNL